MQKAYVKLHVTQRLLLQNAHTSRYARALRAANEIIFMCISQVMVPTGERVQEVNQTRGKLPALSTTKSL